MKILTLICEPDEDGYHVYCHELKGLHIGGDTKEEAIAVAKDAVDIYVKSMLKHGDEIPGREINHGLT